jgi:putative transposase
MRDRDGAFSAAFDQVFLDNDIRVKPVGPQAPNLNAFVERWIQSVKQEALDHFLVFGQEHFDFIVREYVDYYHDCRPHQGIGNVLLKTSDGIPGEEVPEAILLQLAKIKCERRLGGLLKHYYRDAA